MNLRRAISAVGVSTFALSGCSTAYAPKPSPRVAVVMQGGTPVYIREGRVFPGGGFGGDLQEAVQGNAEAESHAKSYRTNMIWGVTTTLVGVASAIGGGILYAANSSGPESEHNTTGQVVGGTLAISGIAAYVTGMVLLMNAQPHLWDAINAYNDGVENGGSQRAYGSHMTLPTQAVYAPPAPADTAQAGAAPVGAAPVAKAPHKAKLPPASPSDGSSLLGATPAANAPPAPAPEADSNAAAPPSSEPTLDLDLDAVEPESKSK